jgi:hypothetical protein
VLARLDEVAGVTESRVDWSGTRILVLTESGANRAAVASDVAAALSGARHVDDYRTVQQVLASYRAGEPWMRAGETLRLSRHEAAVLGEQHGGRAAAEAHLDETATRRLVAAFTREFEQAFERIHAGEDVSLAGELNAASKRILVSSESFLSPQQRAVLAEYLANYYVDR